MLSLCEYWALRERPFEPVTDARFYFQSRAHEEALARLGYLIDQETMYLGMLSGEIGCGKSLTRQIFSSRIDTSRHLAVQFENSAFALDDHLRRLLKEVGWAEVAGPDAGSYDLYELTKALLRQLSTLGRQLVLIFDEAQEMSQETLSALKRLSNLNDEGLGRLTIILIGQPELRPLVARQPALDQRISLRFHLHPLDAADTGAFIRHRLLSAGHSTGDLFDERAVSLLFEASRGVAREINRLAKLSLEQARATGAMEIGGDHVRAVIEDLRRHQSMPVLGGVR